MAASFPGAAVRLAVCWWPSLPWSPALSMGSAALRPPGLRPFTLTCPSLPPTGASSPDEVVANHTSLTNTMLRWWEKNHPCQWRPELMGRAFIPWLLPCWTLAWKCLGTSPCGPRPCFSGSWPTAVPFAWVCDRLPPGLGLVRASVVQPWELHRLVVFSRNSALAFVINSFSDGLSF